MTPYGPGLRQALLDLTEYGWKLFPLRGDGSKIPAVKGWREDATDDPCRLFEWFHQLESKGIRVSLGLATGDPSGVFVVDGDTEEACDWVTSRFAEQGPNVRTSRGGHFYFHMPKVGQVKNSASRIYPKVDVRGTGGLVVVPPSGKKNGGFYEWVHMHIYSAPTDLLHAVAPRERVILPATPPRRFSSKQREQTWIGRKVESAITEAFRAVGATQEGARNDALYRTIFKLGSLARACPSHYVTLYEGALATTCIALERGLPRTEAERTTRDAFERGMELGTHPGFSTTVPARESDLMEGL